MHKWAAAFLALATLASCASTQTSSLSNDYNRAVIDSAVYQRANVRELRPLTPDANGEVIVVTLAKWDAAVGETITSKGTGIWVTGVPEVQTKCRAFTNVDLQLAELLGLPPTAVYPHFLTLRANIADLFRPSPDSSTNTTYPCAANNPIPDDCGNAFPSNATAAHYQWMATAAFSLHQLPNGYPWTHLGYTYDWAPGADRYGASEYVLRSGAKAVVLAKASPAEYCAPPPASSR